MTTLLEQTAETTARKLLALGVPDDQIEATIQKRFGPPAKSTAQARANAEAFARAADETGSA